MGRHRVYVHHDRAANLAPGRHLAVQPGGSPGSVRRTSPHHLSRRNRRRDPLRAGRGRGSLSRVPARSVERHREGHVQGAEEAGRDPDAGAALRSHRHEELLVDGRAVLPGLSVRLRVLRHHQALRSGASDQDTGSDRRGVRHPAPAGLARHRLPGRRQLHRQQARGDEAAAGDRRVAEGPGVSVRSAHGGERQSRPHGQADGRHGRGRVRPQCSWASRPPTPRPC